MGDSDIEQQGQDMTEEERADLIKKAETFLPKEQKTRAEEGVKTQQAIEDAIIARHQARTGRKFPTREQNLQDALDWKAREETQEQEQVGGAIKEVIAYSDKKRAEEQAKSGNLVTTSQTPRPNLAQRVIGFVKGVVGRK